MSDVPTTSADVYDDLATLRAKADGIGRALSAIQRRCVDVLDAPTVVPKSLSITALTARVILTALFVLFG